MRIGVRGRLFLVSVVLIVCAIGLSTTLFMSQLTAWLEEREVAVLLRGVRAARVATESAGGGISGDAADALADTLGAALEGRVTIIARDGRVLGDSSVAADRIAELEDHSRRPEVREALQHGAGVSRRVSVTVGHDLVYAAAPFERPDGSGVVRFAQPWEHVDDTLRRMRGAVLVAGILGLILAAVMSGLASHLAARPLVRLARRARDLADPDRLPAGDEVAGLARSFEVIATDLNEAVATLAMERAQVAATLDGIEDPIVAVNGDGFVESSNRAARGLFGGDPVGRLLVDVIHAPGLAEHLSGSDDGDAELELPGRARVMNVRVTSLGDGPGRVVVMRDVTELRRLEDARRDFVANVSHELRTPLAIIQANAETLLDGALQDPEHARRFTEAIQRNVTRLSELVHDLLELSRIQSRHGELELLACSVRDAAKRALDAIASDATHARRVTVEVDAGTYVLGDDNGVELVLSNLIENALKYTDAHRPVTVRAGPGRGAPGTVRVEVVDQGRGIPLRHHARLFERFYRVDQGRASAVGGTGLGLAIVKHMVEVMGGAAGVESGERRGMTFWFELPAAGPPEPVA